MTRNEMESDSGAEKTKLFGRKNGFVLRRVEARDIPLRVEWFHNPVNRQQMTLPENVTVESTMVWLESIQGDQSRHDFSTEEEASSRTVAMLGVRDKMEDGFPELYILVHPDWQGKGVGTCSLGMMLEWMRAVPQFRGCRLYVAPENLAAVSLYEKFGFEVIGVREDGARLLMQVEWEAT